MRRYPKKVLQVYTLDSTSGMRGIGRGKTAFEGNAQSFRIYWKDRMPGKYKGSLS
jgi:hypothetical protein